MKKYLLALAIFASSGLGARTVELSDAIKIVTQSYPAVESAQFSLNAEKDSTLPLYFPENPMLGIMTEKGMKSWTLSQDILFPSKYYHRGEAQYQRTLAAQEELRNKKLEMRQEIISAYFNAFRQIKTVELLQAQRDLLREIARIAEGRRITGQVTAQDEMKAHLEQAKMENEILTAGEDLESGKARLQELLGLEDSIELGKVDKPRLKMTSGQLNEISLQETPSLKAAFFAVEESNALKNFAAGSFLPDFRISLKRSLEKDNNDKTFALEARIPLWFWGKESGDFSAAQAKKAIAQRNLESAQRLAKSGQRSLAAKIIAKENVLKLYETTLIPQSLSTITSSRSAYKAGRANFLELLDSERTVYGLQINYYQELKEFSLALAEFEKMAGQSVSSLPWEDYL